MDYSRDQDLTAPPRDSRRYRVSGAKTQYRCPQCRGVVTVYVEDTVYRCLHCGSVPEKVATAP